MMLTRNESGNRSMSSEPEGAELIYLKDNVTIHPTQFASERISGRLKLVKHGSSVFMVIILFESLSLFDAACIVLVDCVVFERSYVFLMPDVDPIQRTKLQC